MAKPAGESAVNNSMLNMDEHNEGGNENFDSSSYDDQLDVDQDANDMLTPSN